MSDELPQKCVLRLTTQLIDIYADHMKRRLVSIPLLIFMAIALTALIPLWFISAVIVDAARGRFRFPLARLLSFAVCWAWLETAGVFCAAIFWLTGQSANLRIHYALQRWWAAHLLGALRVTCGIEVRAENIEALQPGPVLMFARHASLADSLVSAYVVTTLAHMNPRYVLKRELLTDPCLDVVGQRLPNHFLDRTAHDSTPELHALETLTTKMDSGTVGIIFPEGTRANPLKHQRALEKISLIDAARGERLQALKHLLPPRVAGAAAMARGSETGDIVLAWHVGFEGLDTFSGILRAIGKSMPPIRFVLRRVPRSEVPHSTLEDTASFTVWLDNQWIKMDTEVDSALNERNSSE